MSTSVKDADSGKIETIIYLLPTAANSPPTGRPNRGSTSEGLGANPTIAIRNEMYMPIKIFKNKPYALRSISISILKAEKSGGPYPDDTIASCS